MRRYNRYALPVGKAHANRKTLAVATTTPEMRRKASTASFVATSKARAKLHDHTIVQADDSSWHIVRHGEVIAICATAAEACSRLLS